MSVGRCRTSVTTKLPTFSAMFRVCATPLLRCNWAARRLDLLSLGLVAFAVYLSLPNRATEHAVRQRSSQARALHSGTAHVSNITMATR